MSEEKDVFIHVEPPINGEKMFGPFSWDLARREADRLTWTLKQNGGVITFVDVNTAQRIRQRIIRARG